MCNLTKTCILGARLLGFEHFPSMLTWKYLDKLGFAQQEKIQNWKKSMYPNARFKVNQACSGGHCCLLALIDVCWPVYHTMIGVLPGVCAFDSDLEVLIPSSSSNPLPYSEP